MNQSIQDERQTLVQGAAELGVALKAEQTDALLKYLDLLGQWSRVYNLTAVRDRSEMLVTHLLDCIAVVPPLQRQLSQMDGAPPRLLDVGSGAGLPGLALAVCLPQLQVTCIDTVAKKAAFVQQAGLQLGLRNLKAVHGRVEKHASQYDVVCSRAFASLQDFVVWTRDCLAPHGVWMALKGKLPQQEMDELKQADVFHVEPLTVPGLHAERCLVWMRPNGVLA